MARVEADAEERVAQAPVDDRLQRAADLPDVERRVPLGDRLEVGRDEAVDVVAHAVRQLVRVLGHPAGPTRQRAPDAERRRERLPAPDRPVGGAEQPERCPRTGGQHEVARQRHAVPAQQPDGLCLGHPGLEAREQPADAVGRLARRVLEHGDLVHVVDHPQAVGGVDQEPVRVGRPSPCRPRGPAARRR